MVSTEELSRRSPKKSGRYDSYNGKSSKEKFSHSTNKMSSSRYATRYKSSSRSRSPVRKEPTNCIHITKLKRPLVLANLKAMLHEFGDFSDSDFWIDQYDSSCIVKYESIEIAKEAQEKLDNSKWPDSDSSRLAVDYTTEEKLKRRREDSVRFKKSAGSMLEKTGLLKRSAGDRKLPVQKIPEVSTEPRQKGASSRKDVNSSSSKKIKQESVSDSISLAKEEPAEKNKRIKLE